MLLPYLFYDVNDGDSVSENTLLLLPTAWCPNGIKTNHQAVILSSVRLRLCEEKDREYWPIGAMVYGWRNIYDGGI